MDPLHAVTPAVVRELLRYGPLTPGKLELAWRAAVGPSLARATRVRLAEKTSVVVVTSDERWRKEVRRSAGVILKRLQQLLGQDVVNDLKVLTAGSDPTDQAEGHRLRTGTQGVRTGH